MRNFNATDRVDEKLDLGIDFCDYHLRHSIDSVKICAIQLLLVDDVSGFTEAYGHKYLGSYFIRVGQIENGISELKKAAHFFDAKGAKLPLSEAFNELGNAYILEGNLESAKKCYQESLRFGSQSNDQTAWFNGSLGLGKVVTMEGDTTEGLRYVLHYKNEALKLLKYEAVADAYGYLANLELNRENNRIAYEYLEKNIFFSKKSNSKIHYAHAINNRAIQYFYDAEFDSSLVYFIRSLRIKEDLNHQKGIVESYLNLGYFYEGIYKYDSALYYFDKSYLKAIENNYYRDAMEAIDLILEMEDGPNEVQFNRYVRISDSLSRRVTEIDDIDLKIYESLNEKLESSSLNEKTNGSMVELILFGFITAVILLFLGFYPFKP